mmetsp:Transcript_18955/g.21774  ORF Transcript_18955/g.21774 Transcript_18955/m.21774 type:complete len:191 (+) Transcript_18955:424-996(+)
MLTIAIKNSLREKRSASIELNEIEEMKVFRPSEEEFKDPINYIEMLYNQGMQEYGCVKIIPPASYKPPSALNKHSAQKLPTRYQTLQQLSQSKPFETNLEGMTCQEIIDKDLGKHEYKELTERQQYDELEKKFWYLVDHSQSEKTVVEYAADLPANEFGTQAIGEEVKADFDHPWNLNKMYLNHNSLLQF